jgi:lipid-binding SYLF domain-containing protein
MGLASQCERVQRVLSRSRALVPGEVLAGARGICVLTELKGALVVSAQVGRGVLLKRLSRHRFGYPSSVICFGLGWGAQAGGERVDHVLVINDDATMRALEGRLQVRLGGDFSVALGPKGVDGTGFVNLGSRGAVSCYSYSFSRGAFCGASLEGSFFCQNALANRSFYGPGHAVAQILDGEVPLEGLSIGVVEGLHTFLYEFERGQVGGLGHAVLPLTDEQFLQVEEEQGRFEQQLRNFRQGRAESQGSNDDAAPRLARSLGSRNGDGEGAALAAISSAGDRSAPAPSASRASGSQVGSATALAARASAEKKLRSANSSSSSAASGASKSSANPRLRSQYEIAQRSVKLVAARASADADLWFKARLEHGPTLVLRADHVVDEELPRFRDHFVISARKGTVCTLIDGELALGLPPPYQDFVMVHIPPGKVGRISKFCLDPFSTDPFGKEGLLVKLL